MFCWRVDCKINRRLSVGIFISKVTFWLYCKTQSRLIQYDIGADECSEGTYATSIPLMHAMDINNDVMLAFGQNGRVLHPDHGYVSAPALSFAIP